MYLGINVYSHDSSACLIDENGKILAAVEEERFTGRKHDSAFPINSINFCLNKVGITTKDIKAIGIGWKPSELLFKRLIKEYIFEYRAPWEVYKKSLIKKFWQGLFLKKDFEKQIGKLNPNVVMRYYKHHHAHAASAFYASGFDDAAFFTLDGRGEYDTGIWGSVDYRNKIQEQGSIHHPHSMGNIWGAVTEFCGFIPGWTKAGTTMAFAALGTPKYMKEFEQMIKFEPEKNKNWLTIDLKYFDNRDGAGYVTGAFEELIGAEKCEHGKDTQVHRDVAATLQAFTEKVIIGKLLEVHKRTGKTKLVMAGGVCLNSVTNAKVLEETPFKDLFIQAASHDAGLSIGCAYLLQQEFGPDKKPEKMNHAYFGPEYSDQEIEESLKQSGLEYRKESAIHETVADLLNQGQVVGWFQGRMEYGPRALGSRSILASAADGNMIEKLNKIKHRESFRPFAISLLEDYRKTWLTRGHISPFMLIVDSIKEELRGRVPAAQHVDGTVRTQTINRYDNGLYYQLLERYYDMSGIPLFINTSFNIKGQPIVRTPEQAIEAFEEVGIDALAIGSFLVTKKK